MKRDCNLLVSVHFFALFLWHMLVAAWIELVEELSLQIEFEKDFCEFTLAAIGSKSGTQLLKKR